MCSPMMPFRDEVWGFHIPQPSMRTFGCSRIWLCFLSMAVLCQSKIMGQWQNLAPGSSECDNTPPPRQPGSCQTMDRNMHEPTWTHMWNGTGTLLTTGPFKKEKQECMPSTCLMLPSQCNRCSSLASCYTGMYPMSPSPEMLRVGQNQVQSQGPCVLSPYPGTLRQEEYNSHQLSASIESTKHASKHRVSRSQMGSQGPHHQRKVSINTRAF